MESADDADNLFEDNDNRENDEEANEVGNSVDPNNETATGTRVQPVKRVVKNPRLKFNPERLCGERGIPILVDHFKNVKFKGKGHEKEDLDKLLSKLEHWTHRLFPSMKFADCLHQIEKLGKKRPVQTCLRKIRLNMPILGSDFVKEDEEDDVQRNEDLEPPESDAFDRLLGESLNYNDIPTVESVMNSGPFSVFSSPLQNDHLPQSQSQVLGSSETSLNEEQKERLERNRRLAIERRKARLAAEQENAVESSLISNRESFQENQSFDSLFSDKGNLLGDNTHSNHHENNGSSSLKIDSDNLELDDLMDLVNKEEMPGDKNGTSLSSEHSEIIGESTLKKTVKDDQLSQVDKLQTNESDQEEVADHSMFNDAKLSKTVSCKELEATSDENLQLDSLMELVSDNTEEFQECTDPCSPGDKLQTNESNQVTDHGTFNDAKLSKTVSCKEATSCENIPLDSLMELVSDNSEEFQECTDPC